MGFAAIFYYNQRRPRWLLVLLAIASFVGCGSDPATTYPVSGKVVFDDGKPFTTGGVVMFEPIAVGEQPVYTAAGAIAADGTFRISTFQEGDGAVAGEHRVLVRAKRDVDTFGKFGRLQTSKAAIAPRFENYETSGLVFTVEPSINEFTVVVKRP